jgi:putative redox protein
MPGPRATATLRARMTFTASARPVDGTLGHEIDVNARHTITTDEPQGLGGGDIGPAPHELLAAMVASCFSTMIVLYARQRDWGLEDVRVDVTYGTDCVPRRIEVAIHLPFGLSAEQVRRLHRVADACPVRRAFEAGFAFHERLLLDIERTAEPVA